MTARVLIGRFGQLESLLVPGLEVTVHDITLEKGGSILARVPRGAAVFLLPIFGSVLVEGGIFAPEDLEMPMIPLRREQDFRYVPANDSRGAEVLLFAGRPQYR